ncbi:MAG: hypothetical protein C4K49_08630 [Candidatus Thorarchaeota archaeon]|nr:MAG: hypothetical protein C4K49_08630 [Candidatus Thorarchaeota archaeon]
MSNEESISHALTVKWKLWLEHDGNYVFGRGAYEILKAVDETGTITEGAMRLGMSYRYAWGVIREIEKKLGARLIETHKGGTVGGGGARVTELGHRLMRIFARVSEQFERVAGETSEKRS